MGLFRRPVVKHPTEEGAMDELKAQLALQKSIEELTAQVGTLEGEMTALKAIGVDVAAIKETIEALADDAKSLDTVAEKLLERVEAIEVAMGAPKGEGDEPPAQKSKELVANVVRPVEFQRR